MRILILGGTRFVGRHLAEAALARGHDVVLFNRGLTNPDLFSDVRTVRGDRQAGGLERKLSGQFDAVFDTGAYHPADVVATAGLRERVGNYTLVSTISVYRDSAQMYADETAPSWDVGGPLPREFSTPAEYGRLKAGCEKQSLETHGNHALIIRPGLIVGPYDYTDRLTSWMHRMTRRRKLLAADPGQPLQLIDVRDLADWMVRAVEGRLTGVMNAVGPDEPLSFAQFLSRAATALSVDPEVAWVGDQFVVDHGVSLPLWVPRSDHPFFAMSNARAVASGLVLRPLAETVAQVQRALETAGPGVGIPGDLSDQREDELLAAFESAKR